MTPHLDALRGIVGAQGLITDSGARQSYEMPQRHGAGKAAAVLRPASTGEVSQVLAYCTRHRLRVIPQGGNTGLVGASTPDASGTELVLSLSRLNKVIEVDAANRTVSVDAGVRLSALNAALEPHGLWFPIDLGSDPAIGGMIATNTGGARFIRYGDVRRNLCGIEVVLADKQGTVLKLGSGLRKDNTGLDLKQLFVASNGALGVITRAELEVHRRPQQTAGALLVPRDDDAILELLTALETGAGEYLSAFEGMSQGVLEHVLRHFPRLTNPFGRNPIPDYSVLVELSRSWVSREGEQTLEDVLARCIEPLLASGLLRDAYIGREKNLWDLRHSLSEGLRSTGQVVGFDLAVRRADIPRFRSHMKALLAAQFPDFQICDFGHIGDGGLHFNLLAQAPADAARVAALRNFVIEELVQKFGGSFSGEHGLGRANQDWYDRYKPAQQRRLAGAIQRLFATGELGAIHFGDQDKKP
ncbi:MAG: FAD-binding oxidoreductase [Pseudomonadota bacterium]